MTKLKTKILIIKNDKIGDMVSATGLFREIKKKIPNAEIDLIVSKENKPLVEKNTSINNIYTLNYSPRTIKEFWNYYKMSRIMKENLYDFAIELRGSFWNIFFLLKAKYKTAILWQNHNENISKLFLNDYLIRDINLNENLNFLKLINKSLGINGKDYFPEIATDKQDNKNVDNFLQDHNLKNYICVVPEASLKIRQWPMGNWDKLIKCLKQDYPSYKILIVGKDLNKLDGLYQNNKFCYLAVDKNLREVYLLFKKSRLVIAQDGGPTHIAYASKAKLIALMAKSLPVKNVGPLGKNSYMMIDDINNISVKQVYNKIKKIL